MTLNNKKNNKPIAQGVRQASDYRAALLRLAKGAEDPEWYARCAVALAALQTLPAVIDYFLDDFEDEAGAGMLHRDRHFAKRIREARAAIQRVLDKTDSMQLRSFEGTAGGDKGKAREWLFEMGDLTAFVTRLTIFLFRFCLDQSDAWRLNELTLKLDDLQGEDADDAFLSRVRARCHARLRMNGFASPAEARAEAERIAEALKKTNDTNANNKNQQKTKRR